MTFLLFRVKYLYTPMLLDFSHAVRVQIVSGCAHCAEAEISKVTPVLNRTGNVIWAEVAAPMHSVKETFKNLFTGRNLPFSFTL